MWIQLNLGDPSAIADFARVMPLAERVAVLDDELFWGMPRILLGAMHASRPTLLGGNPHVLPRALGYNLNRRGRNFGVGFDNYLYLDNREIMPGLGFTLEPGIYSKHYALRLCANLFLEGDRELTLSAPLQRKLIAVLGDPALVTEAFVPPLD